MKEKKLIEEFNDGGVRFQGEIPRPDGSSYLDRTTLTPVPGDRVHQVIEISRDGGKTWQATFNAEYRRSKVREQNESTDFASLNPRFEDWERDVRVRL